MSGWHHIYDKNTTSKSFFALEYKKFLNFIDFNTYDFFVSKKYNTALSDGFLSKIKFFLIKSLYLIQNSFQSEVHLTEDNHLQKFFTNVLEYIKIEKLYLCYLAETKTPASSNIKTITTLASQTETQIHKSLKRFLILIIDLHTLFDNPQSINGPKKTSGEISSPITNQQSPLSSNGITGMNMSFNIGNKNGNVINSISNLNRISSIKPEKDNLNQSLMTMNSQNLSQLNELKNTIIQVIKYFERSLLEVSSCIALIPSNNKNYYQDEIKIIGFIEIALKEFDKNQETKIYKKKIKYGENFLNESKSIISMTDNINADISDQNTSFTSKSSSKSHISKGTINVPKTQDILIQNHLNNSKIAIKNNTANINKRYIAHEYFNLTTTNANSSFDLSQKQVKLSPICEDSSIKNNNLPILRNSSNYGRILANLKQHDSTISLKLGDSTKHQYIVHAELEKSKKTMTIPPHIPINEKIIEQIPGSNNILNWIDVNIDHTGEINMKVNETQQLILDEMKRKERLIEEEKQMQLDEIRKKEETAAVTAFELENKKSNDSNTNSDSDDDSDIDTDNLNDDINDQAFAIKLRNLKNKGKRKALMSADNEDFKILDNYIDKDNLQLQEINAYNFYEMTTIEDYAKPDKAYLAQTEKVIERAADLVPDELLDYCYTEDIITKQRKIFLTSIYGKFNIQSNFHYIIN